MKKGPSVGLRNGNDSHYLYLTTGSVSVWPWRAAWMLCNRLRPLFIYLFNTPKQQN